MNSAYKHLDAKLKIAELTLGQWAGLVAGVIIGILYTFYLEPFGTTLTLFTGVYVAGLPICAIFLASMSEFDFGLLVASAIRYRRGDNRYLPGPGASTKGYRLVEQVADSEHEERQELADIDLRALWGAQ